MQLAANQHFTDQLNLQKLTCSLLKYGKIFFIFYSYIFGFICVCKFLKSKRNLKQLFSNYGDADNTNVNFNFQDTSKSFLKETSKIREQKWTGQIHEKSFEKRHKKQIIMLRRTIFKGILHIF
jgi:hypothetical protein